MRKTYKRYKLRAPLMQQTGRQWVETHFHYLQTRQPVTFFGNADASIKCLHLFYERVKPKESIRPLQKSLKSGFDPVTPDFKGRIICCTLKMFLLQWHSWEPRLCNGRYKQSEGAWVSGRNWFLTWSKALPKTKSVSLQFSERGEKISSLFVRSFLFLLSCFTMPLFSLQ